ncbi:MAG: flagellin [Deltaproteobacteria bacterium]|nr:flagellin [Deltaproteobacteria bacterium]
MGLRIQNNISAMNAHRQLSIADSSLAKSLERLSSGYRINSGADDAAGLAISNSMRADIASFKVASRNTSEANALLQVAGGALSQVSSMLTRLKELATQASSANANSNLTKINDEAAKVIAEIDRIADSTEYADTMLINGTFGVSISGCSSVVNSASGYSGVSGMKQAGKYTFTTDAGATTITLTHAGGSEAVYGVSAPTTGTQSDVYFSSVGITLKINSGFTGTSDFTITASASGSADFQVGAENTADNRIAVSLGNATKEKLGTTAGSSALTDIDLTSAAKAQSALDYIDDAISDISKVQGDVGAYQNRLSFAALNLATTTENMQAAESVIRDVDMAAEMTTFTKNQILMQAGTAMLAQANMAPQQVLSLFG